MPTTASLIGPVWIERPGPTDRAPTESYPTPPNSKWLKEAPSLSLRFALAHEMRLYMMVHVIKPIMSHKVLIAVDNTLFKVAAVCTAIIVLKYYVTLVIQGGKKTNAGMRSYLSHKFNPQRYHHD